MKSLDDILTEVPAARRRRIAKRANELITQEMTMRQLRKARHLTQSTMAEALGVKQEQISRLEKRADLHLSTLKRHIEALGGQLNLVVSFPNSAPIRLGGFADLPASPQPRSSQRKPPASRVRPKL